MNDQYHLSPSSMNDSIQMNLRHLMDRGIKCQPDVEIVTRIADGKYHRITYLEAQRKAVRVASALNKLGVNIGDRIGTFMWNNSRHMILYYAVPAMGSGIYPIHPQTSHPQNAFYSVTHAQYTA